MTTTKILMGVLMVTLYFCSYAQEICGNGIDDDGNGYVDCEDLSCFSSPDCPAFQYPVNCPPGAVLGQLLGARSFFRSSATTTGNSVTVPAGTQFIRFQLHGSNSLFASSTDDNLRWHDEDFIQTIGYFDVASGKSFGFQSYVINTNTDGSGRMLRGWRDCPSGSSITAFLTTPSFSGLPVSNAQSFVFTLSGSTFTISEQNSATAYRPDITCLVEFYSGSSASSHIVQNIGYHSTWYESSRKAFYVPATIDKIILNFKGLDYTLNDWLNPSAGKEEGTSNGRVVLDKTANKKWGVFTCINGSHTQKRSNYIYNDITVANTFYSTSLSTGGDVAADNPGTQSYSEASLYQARIYWNGDSLIIDEGPAYHYEFETVYSIDLIDTKSTPVNNFIKSGFIGHGKNQAVNGWVTRSVPIPFGTKYIEVRQVGCGSNVISDNNENPLESYAFIDLSAGTANGYLFQQINTDGGCNYIFNGVLTDEMSTWFNSTGKHGNLMYDLTFDIYTTPGALRIRNRYGNIANDYETLTFLTFYGGNVDASMPLASNQVVNHSGLCLYTNTNVYCNQGSANIESNFPVSFYAGNPFTSASAVLLETTTLGADIPVGKCATLTHSFYLTNFDDQTFTLYTVLGDNGSEVNGGVGTAIGTPLLTNASIQAASGFTDCAMTNNVISKLVAPVCSALPVELLSFSATQCEREVCLEWVTASEVNSDYYVIARSGNLIDWQVLGTVDSYGTTNTETIYTYTDQAPVSGVLYYRLLQYDTDGNQSKEEIRSVLYAVEETNLLPNPFENSVLAHFSDGHSHEIRIVDSQGRIMKIVNVSNGQTIQLEGLPDGMYIALIDGEKTQKLIKQNQ